MAEVADVTLTKPRTCNVTCLLCGAPIPDSKFRRNVHGNSDEMREVKELIVELLESSCNSSDVKAYLDSAKVVCKTAKCFGTLSRIVKLRKDLTKLEDTVATTLNSTMMQHNIAKQGSSEQPRKRQSTHAAVDNTPPPKKSSRSCSEEIMCTPVRKFMHQPANDTPVLAVSFKL